MWKTPFVLGLRYEYIYRFIDSVVTVVEAVNLWKSPLKPDDKRILKRDKYVDNPG